MGLMIHSLEGIGDDHQRDYYIYLLDYGWHEPLGRALRKNFSRMADISSKQKNSVVVMGADEGTHFSDEVLSWHCINGENVEKNQLLPAILVTNRHPQEFRKRAARQVEGGGGNHLKLVLIPLKKYCCNTTEVTTLIQTIFSKIKRGEDLNDFFPTKQKVSGVDGAYADSIILEKRVGKDYTIQNMKEFFEG